MAVSVLDLVPQHLSKVQKTGSDNALLTLNFISQFIRNSFE